MSCILCENEDIRARGLCKSHYKRALKEVTDGLTTWEHLVAVGRALPRSARGRPAYIHLEKKNAIIESRKRAAEFPVAPNDNRGIHQCMWCEAIPVRFGLCRAHLARAVDLAMDPDHPISLGEQAREGCCRPEYAPRSLERKPDGTWKGRWAK